MPSPRLQARILYIAASGIILLTTAGCAKEKVHAAPPVTTAPSAPIETKQPEPPPANPPKIDAQPAPAPLPTGTNNPPVVPRPKPKKPSSDASGDSSAASSDQPSHPPAPQISPQLSPADQQVYERKTNEDVAAAEGNLQQAKGKQLSAAQKDLQEKIRSFLAQSREASKTGDWARAQNLAQKARLLSNELVGSL
jgi:hypothetical protein